MRTKTVPAEALYDLACYYAAVGQERMSADASRWAARSAPRSSLGWPAPNGPR